MVFNPKTETNMKILINTTPLNKLGGVSNHFKGLKPYWSKDVRYFCIGVRKWRTVFFFYYLTKYILCLLFYRPDVVVLNPSMAKKAIKRDFTYMNIAELFHCQVVIMFHGFHVVQVAGMEQEIVAYLNRCSFIYCGICVWILRVGIFNSRRPGIFGNFHMARSELGFVTVNIII